MTNKTIVRVRDVMKEKYDIVDGMTTVMDALKKNRDGLVVSVFDTTDRIQHMFWRFLEENHPALRGQENSHADSIRDMYVRMDDLVGRTPPRTDPIGLPSTPPRCPAPRPPRQPAPR